VNWYNTDSFQLPRQFFFIPNGINEFVDHPALIFLLLPESVLLEVDHYLDICTCSALQ
jgi:hypothetical protein